MLSPGQFHKLIPKDPVQNVRLRLAFYRACAGNPNLQRGFWLLFQRDLVAYINLCVWQFNPLKKTGRIGPFITWDFQEEILLARPDNEYGFKGILWTYENDKTTVCEKSREMGFSWLFLIFQDWLCLFQENVQALNISRSTDAVDSKSANSLFWKIRFMHQHLPAWLRGEIEELKLFFGFKRTGSEIAGEASTGRAGVGGRATVIFVDEFSQIREDVEVRQRTASTADCRFFNGTHIGMGTEFYRLTKEPEINKIVAHWSRHPEKRKGLYQVDDKGRVTLLDQSLDLTGYDFVLDGSPTGGPRPGVRSPWYDRKVQDIGQARGVAMELDIDPAGSVSQVFDPLLIYSLVREYCCEPYWEGDLLHDHGRPIKLVQRKGGKLRLWVHLQAGRPPFGRYGAGADTATGIGATPSCLTIGSADTGDKVAEYADATIAPRDFADLAVALCWLFKDQEGTGARLCWEAHGPGENFGQKVAELGYGHIYYREPEVPSARLARGAVPGWAHTPNSIAAVIGSYLAALRERRFLNRSKLALLECLLFKYDEQGSITHAQAKSKDDPSGARVNHADRVIADALAWKMMDALGTLVAEPPAPKGPAILSLEWRRQWHREQQEMEAS